MTTLPVYAFVILSMLAGIGPKKYEHSYHTGGVHLMNISGHTEHHAKCQLDYTVIKDSLIYGRFQIFDVPLDWKAGQTGTFHGVITKLDSSPNTSFGFRMEPGFFDWEAICSFDGHEGKIMFAKTMTNSKGHDHFLGKLEVGTKLGFYLE